MDIIHFLSIRKDDPKKWVKYYEIETSKYYDYLLNMIPNNQQILEIGSGGGVFYVTHQDVLTKRNNQYTCIDINEQSIGYSKTQCDYVDFQVKNVCDYTIEDFAQYDMLLLVQSYIQIPNIETVFETYFESNPNGCIMMVNTIFPPSLKHIVSFCKTRMLPKLLNNDCVTGKALTLCEIGVLSERLGRTVTNIFICKSLSGFSEYLTIIR
jgi:2-polyprenyl-3-methyl-5-hydroxy-6-metoxy-1,4-benzoquinol methylase